jgi:hypothetical protein
MARGRGDVHWNRATTFWHVPWDKQVVKTLRESQTGSETRQTYITKTRVKRLEVREPPCHKFLFFVITHFNTLASISYKCFRRIGIRPRGWVGCQFFCYCADNTQLSQACCIFAVQCSTVLYCSTAGMQPTFTMGTGSSSGVKRPGCGVDDPHLSSVEG